MIEDPTGLEEMTTAYYKNLYTSEGVHNIEEVLRHVPTKVTPDMNALLNAPYTNEEVKCALFQMFPIKAPGPDGYPAHFFQRQWEVCGEEVTKVVLKIVEGNESVACINDMILVLIPKVKKPYSPQTVQTDQSMQCPLQDRVQGNIQPTQANTS